MRMNRRGVAVAWTVLALTGSVSTQGSAGGARVEEREVLGKVALEGFVVDPEGNPAAGVLVLCSAGGKAETDAAGSYRLELERPAQATSVEVTAFGSSGANTTASASVALAGAAGTIRLAPLQLLQGTACVPGWMPTFGEAPGTHRPEGGSTPVACLAVFDDGSGPALYVGGHFATAGVAVANNIARWDGSSWGEVSGGVSDPVAAMAVFDDGNGPALYVAGGLRIAGGITANRIARWNGSSWSRLGPFGPNNGANDWISALAVFDDGNGPALYLGGAFTSVGGVTAKHVARWDGTSWSRLGPGRPNPVLALTVFDDGGGARLYAVGGQYLVGGPSITGGFARWDGSSWTLLGSMNGAIKALATFDDGSGPALFAGGEFTVAGGVPAEHVAKWNGSGFMPLGAGLDGDVLALTAFDDGSGPALFAGGEFTSAGGVTTRRVARWDGSSWAALGGGIGPRGTGGIGRDSGVHALAVFDDGGGPLLCVGGSFQHAGSTPAINVANWGGTSWGALGAGLDAPVTAIVGFDDGGGPALVAAGAFAMPGDAPPPYLASHVSKREGSSWVALGGTMNNEISVLAVMDLGSGPSLYAGGSFTAPARGIARWNGSRWVALGSGLGGTTASAYTLAAFDDGGGSALYVGGTFEMAGGLTVHNIAKWTGSSWSQVGSGTNSTVRALVVFDDGSGPALYAGGSFISAGGVPANRVARWNGTSWAAVGGGFFPSWATVYDLAVFDDGSGPALYAGSYSDSSVARWDGSAWTTLGAPTTTVHSLVVHDYGSGPALYTAGGSLILRWDGSSWAGLFSGLNGPASSLLSFDDGSGPALYAGGSFTACLASGDSFLAKWGCPDTEPPALSCPSSITVPDGFADGPGEVVSFTIEATDALDPSPDVVCVPPSGSVFPPGTTQVLCTATDASGNPSTCEFPVTVQPKARRR